MAKFVIPRQAAIGAAAAENDDAYLADCFVDTGMISQLLSPANSVSILSGRTGSGKSAIISRIKDEQDHVCEVRPESLSLSFLADSWLLKTLSIEEFDLGLFYQQLWRHVIIIELLKYEKGLTDAKKAAGFITQFQNLFRNDSQKKRAFEYLTQYGGTFWEDTELRVRHIAEGFEGSFQSEMGIKFGAMQSKVQNGEKLSVAESKELVVNARKIVNSIQMQELANIIDIMDEHIFDDKKKQVILVIDDLDQQWTDERIRIKLIEALINVLPKFRKIRNVKVIVAMRDDLLDIVLAQATTPGFQREKFEDQRQKISWNGTGLAELVDRRIEKLFKSKYTNEHVKLSDIIVSHVNLQPTMAYILDRSMMRPRDVLAYFNRLLDRFGGSTQISQKDVRSIELDFSTDRRRALVDEWRGFYTYIDDVIGFLAHRNLSAEFRIGAVDKDILADWVLLLNTKYESIHDPLIAAAKSYFENNTDDERMRFLRQLISVLYRVGAVGVKTQANSRVQFSFINRPYISGGELSDNTPCLVHPMLWQNLSRRGEAKNLFQ